MSANNIQRRGKFSLHYCTSPDCVIVLCTNRSYTNLHISYHYENHGKSFNRILKRGSVYYQLNEHISTSLLFWMKCPFCVRSNLGVLDFCASVDWQLHSSFSTTNSVGSCRVESSSFDSLFSHIYKCLIHSKFKIKIYFVRSSKTKLEERNNSVFGMAIEIHGRITASGERVFLLKSTNT